MASGGAHRLEARASRRERMNARSLPRAKLAIVRAHAGPRWPFRSLPKTDATIGCAQLFAGPPRDAKGDVPTAPSALANPRPRFDREIALVALSSPSAAARGEPGASQRGSWRPPSSAPLRSVARGARSARRCTILTTTGSGETPPHKRNARARRQRPPTSSRVEVRPAS